jgi:uncharacterized protein YqcC (DUF446 family)
LARVFEEDGIPALWQRDGRRDEEEDEMNQYLLVAGLLGELTAELQRLERWQAEHPGAEALASELPFCVDTLSFDQWLQFVLIPRMEQLVLLQAPLPTSVSLYPMASEAYKDELAEVAGLLRLIGRFDLLLTGKVVDQ